MMGLWLMKGDADFSTLFAHWLSQGRSDKYRGRVVWITGASSGIGEEIAYIFARFACRLVLSGTRLEELERVRNRCEMLSPDCQVLIVQGNIASCKDHPKWVERVLEKFGTVDILVNNAGRSQRSDFTKIPEEIDREMFDVNVFGMISLTREVVKHWLSTSKRDGEILVTSSTAGKLGAPYSATYSGTKHALHGYFEGLRSEMCIEEVPMKITLACPGPVRSNIRAVAYTDKVGVQFNKPDTPDQKVMPTARCAQLMVSALAAGLDETWIAPQPILFIYYIAQYMPSTFRRWLLPLFMNKNTMKVRDGH